MIGNRSWGDVYVSAVVRGETCTRAAWLADAWERRRHREPVAWQGPPQHHWKRGWRRVARVLDHMRSLQLQLVTAFGKLEGLEIGLRRAERENARLRELLRYVWWQTSGDKLRDRIDGEAMLRCHLRADIMRQVAALFVEEDGDQAVTA